jgi:hypothetical protein
MKHYFCNILIFALLAALWSCGQKEQAKAKTTEEATVQANETAAVTEPKLKPVELIQMDKQAEAKSSDKKQPWQFATITFLNLEGGFFGLITDKGNKLLPMNLAKEFQLHGAKIKFKGEIQKGIFTIQQWGTPFKISAIELMSSGSEQLK